MDILIFCQFLELLEVSLIDLKLKYCLTIYYIEKIHMDENGIELYRIQ